MNNILLCLALVAGSVAQSQPQGRATQAELDRLAADLGYRFAIVDNNPATCPGDAGGCFVSEIAISAPARLPAPLANGVEIRFGYVSRILSSESDTFAHRLINGDLHALTLKPGRALRPGATHRIRLIGAGSFFSRAYPMPNAHLAAPGLAARTIAATRPTIDRDTGLEHLAFVAPMTDEANLATASPEDRTRWLTPERAFARYAERGGGGAPDFAILPRPLKASRPVGAPLDVTRGVRTSLVGIERGQVAPALAALADAGVGSGAVPLTVNVGRANGLAPEAYRLLATDGAIRIDAADAAGASHALRSLAQQAAYEKRRLRPLLVEDAPRLPFRGLHIDVARNFHSKAELLKLVEQLAAFKLNKLHLHLGDDEGWRLEIPTLPELTEVGAFRCYDPTEMRCLQPQLGADPDRAAPVNGYLSRADYLDILRAAGTRQIEVIPSFDMPGHSRAAIRAMEVRHARLTAAGRRQDAERYRLVDPADTTEYRSIQNYNDNTLNVCLDATYRFLDTVLDEVAALHRAAGTPLKTYHIGADETAGAWGGSPACKAMMARLKLTAPQLGAHFIERVSGDLAKRGIAVAGWSDGMGHTAAARMPAKVQSNAWGGLFTGGIAEAHDQANRGWDVVVSLNDVTYLDMPHVPHPQEGGYDWGTREVDAFKIFSFMPGNLPANASVMTNRQSRPARIADATPLRAGRRIMGLQAQLWSETTRTDAQVDYQLFPRLLALAERAWHRPAWEPAYAPGAAYAHGDGKVDASAIAADWRDFAGRVAAQLPALERAGVGYRLAPPGARIANGRLEANGELPGVTIEYRSGAGPWRRYAGPVVVTGPVTLRARTFDGRRASRSVTVAPWRRRFCFSRCSASSLTFRRWCSPCRDRRAQIVSGVAKQMLRVFRAPAHADQDGALDVAAAALEGLRRGARVDAGEFGDHRDGAVAQLAVGHAHVDHQPAVNASQAQHDGSGEDVQRDLLRGARLHAGRAGDHLRPRVEQDGVGRSTQ